MVKDWKGLGDAVAAATGAVGIHPKEDCGCKKRQEWLNRHVSFKRPAPTPPTTTAAAMPRVPGVRIKIGSGDWQ